MSSSMISGLNASLDAASYIISLGIVDFLTFGVPVHAQQSEHDDERKHSRKWASQENSPVEWSHSRSPSFKQSNHPQRSFSDPGLMNGGKDEKEGLNLTRNHTLEEFQTHSKQHHPHKPSHLHITTANDGLHHYQKKIFSRQVQKTLRIQPYVRFSILICLLFSWLFSSILFTLIISQGFRQGISTTFYIIFTPLSGLWNSMLTNTIRMFETGQKILLSSFKDVLLLVN